jgi:7-cyano-7-deazaguanine synthase
LFGKNPDRGGSEMKKKAICLLSGGLDSTTSLYVALREGYEVLALTIHYGQTHAKEIDCAREIARILSIRHFVIPVSMPWKGSALLDEKIQIPSGRDPRQMASEIPVTYVPARNSIFLSLAASWAETEKADAVFIGANALDYSGYPDCRPEFLEAFERMLAVGTKVGVEGSRTQIKAPLLRLSKKEIVLLAADLYVPLAKTWSCYRGGDTPCGECDSCVLRSKGFSEAGLPDPLVTNAISRNS